MDSPIRMHRHQLKELTADYAENTPEADARLRERLRAWRRWMHKGYTIAIPGRPPVELVTKADWDRWLSVRFGRIAKNE